ncbi:MAG: bifunctional serine/threonine-protein kinase/formylglycine-generating enzyme family protein [Myxococcota bacterium]
MLDDAVLELAARYGLDPEGVAELVALVESATEGADHLRRVHLLGEGGTAEVWEAEDTQLGRRVAMKVLRAELAADPNVRERFLREARATAQLVHPGIVPIHEIGQLSDGRPWFTMAVVRGRTLGEVAREIPATQAGLRRVVEVFRRAVDAVSYAHERGVLHRDLKPANIMVGPFGTVFVLDWGLFRATESAVLAVREGHTRLGSVAGTPGYFSPEQARGEVATPASDVFALGAVLFELLHGRPLFDRRSPREAMVRVARGEIPPCTDGPETLRELVDRALAADPRDRPTAASEVARVLGAWLDGEAQRELALRQVARAAALRKEETSLRIRIESTRVELRRQGAALPTWAPVAERSPLWRRSTELAADVDRADALRRERLQTLHGALTHDSSCAEVLEALAAHWHAMHADAEARGDAAAVAEAEAELRHVDRGAHRVYLEGRGALHLATTPHAVPATLYRYEKRDRVLEPRAPRSIGVTPIEQPLDMGRYLVELQSTPPIRVPLWIPRNHRWQGPPVTLLQPDAMGPDDCYVPAGPFFRGTQSPMLQALPGGLVSVDAFIVRRFPVTHAEYIAFLDDLVDQGRETEALQAAPRERSARPDQPGPLCYARDAQGHFTLVADADGDVWQSDWPVFLVDYAGACAYAAWEADRTGRPWRLPTEEEWEKAARGVDGRAYPWGDEFVHPYANVRTSREGRPLPASVHDFRVDCSVYGVRGMAGNVREWCSTQFYLPSSPSNAAAEQVVRGGCWFFTATGAHLAARFAVGPGMRGDTVGFRLFRSLVAADLAKIE